jgi:hypothetical protein
VLRHEVHRVCKGSGQSEDDCDRHVTASDRTLSEPIVGSPWNVVQVSSSSVAKRLTRVFTELAHADLTTSVLGR